MGSGKEEEEELKPKEIRPAEDEQALEKIKEIEEGKTVPKKGKPTLLHP